MRLPSGATAVHGGRARTRRDGGPHGGFRRNAASPQAPLTTVKDRSGCGWHHAVFSKFSSPAGSSLPAARAPRTRRHGLDATAGYRLADQTDVLSSTTHIRCRKELVGGVSRFPTDGDADQKISLADAVLMPGSRFGRAVTEARRRGQHLMMICYVGEQRRRSPGLGLEAIQAKCCTVHHMHCHCGKLVVHGADVKTINQHGQDWIVHNDNYTSFFLK